MRMRSTRATASIPTAMRACCCRSVGAAELRQQRQREVHFVELTVECDFGAAFGRAGYPPGGEELAALEDNVAAGGQGIGAGDERARGGNVANPHGIAAP